MTHVRRFNAHTGHHFFDPDTMRFFRSRIGTELINGRFFITSEQPPHGEREYTVRRANDDGTISDVGGFGAFTTGAAARRYARRLLPNASPCANCRELTHNPNFTCDACAAK